MVTSLFLLLFIVPLAFTSKEFSFAYENEISTNKTEVINQLNSIINVNSFDIDIEIIQVDPSPSMECVTRELFRIYEPFCYRRTYGRGAGYPLDACPSNAPDRSGLLCYPKCQDGYVGVGPVCWQDCGNLTAVGPFCVGSAVSSPTSSNDGGDRFEGVKSSYKHFFVRKSYGRGVGSAMICSSQYEQSGALCYNYCDKKYFGVGPVCWQYCPSSQPTSCTIGCSITFSDCTKVIIDMFTSIASVAMNILRLKIVRSFIEKIANDLIISATENDWILVARNMSILSNKFAETIISDVSKKCDTWPYDTLQSATQNASLLFTVTAFNNTNILQPYLKLFNVYSIIEAFAHGLCNLPDSIFK